MYMVKILQE